MNKTDNVFTKSAIAIVNKPTGMNSLNCVKRVKKKLGALKAGHLGTLDPLASGVLVVALNKATKMFESHLSKNKIYRAVFKFGVQTTTLDSEGEVEKRQEVEITQEQVKQAIANFTGQFNQMPPAFSAKKIGGKKAYQLARAGKQVNLKTKTITIHAFEFIKQLEKNTFLFEIKCSSGTYIRSIARDLASSLGTVGTMVGLVRLASGEYDLLQGAEIENLEIEHLIEVEI